MFRFHATFRNLLLAASLLLVAGLAVGEMPDVHGFDESIGIVSGGSHLQKARSIAVRDRFTTISNWTRGTLVLVKR